MKTKARTLAGFMELTPEKQIVFNQMEAKIREVFEKNGLTPMDTPILEYSEVLLAKAGGETEKQIYRFEKGDSDLCMRFDLTVPFAKYTAMHQNTINFPFRRYQIGKVFRGERTQKGRFREFYQCDMDIIDEGELSLWADAECISVLSQIYYNLGQKIHIKISNRKILSGILEELGEKENQNQILNILDKLDKIGEEKTLELLSEATSNAEKILEIVKVADIGEIEKLPYENEVFKKGVEEIKQLFKNLRTLRMDNRFDLDLKIIRGLDYYTGSIFEAILVGENISVGGGGRYENLAGNYTDKKLSGVGVSVGLTRLFDILDKNGKLPFPKATTAKVAIIPLGDTNNHCFLMAEKLRDRGINTQVLYFDKSFKSKMNYANKIGVPFIMVIGDDELRSGVYGLKNMYTGEVFENDFESILERLKGSQDV